MVTTSRRKVGPGGPSEGPREAAPNPVPLQAQRPRR